MDSNNLYAKDLDCLDFPKSIGGAGDPVRHFESAMHTAALLSGEAMPRLRIDIIDFKSAAELSVALPRFHAKGFVGLNLTVPHKVWLGNSDRTI